MTAQMFAVGDRIVICNRSKMGFANQAAVITQIINNVVYFVGDHNNDLYVPARSGFFEPSQVGKKMFGVQHVEIVNQIKSTHYRPANWAVLLS